MWITVPPQDPPLPSSVLRCGPVTLSVGLVAHDPRRWQYFGLAFSVFSEDSQGACEDSWPREAIALAREELDALEEYLEKQEES